MPLVFQQPICEWLVSQLRYPTELESVFFPSLEYVCVVIFTCQTGQIALWVMLLYLTCRTCLIVFQAMLLYLLAKQACWYGGLRSGLVETPPQPQIKISIKKIKMKIEDDLGSGRKRINRSETFNNIKGCINKKPMNRPILNSMTNDGLRKEILL